ncbi:hypothetical protein KI387_017539, partial [Taxus chinensis]
MAATEYVSHFSRVDFKTNSPATKASEVAVGCGGGWEHANPLLEVLLGNEEGAGMCLQDLVNKKVWKFTPEDIVNEVHIGYTRTLGHLELPDTSKASHKLLIFQ